MCENNLKSQIRQLHNGRKQVGLELLPQAVERLQNTARWLSHRSIYLNSTNLTFSHLHLNAQLVRLVRIPRIMGVSNFSGSVSSISHAVFVRTLSMDIKLEMTY